MSTSNVTLHGLAGTGTLVLVGAAGVVVALLGQAAPPPPHEPPLKEMIAIEAQLAKKAEKKVQPQKELKAPEPPPKPEGVSHDENKVPEEPKKEEPKKPPPKDAPPVDLSKKFKHTTDDDAQPGAGPATDIGQFNGSEKGFAPINAGNPYWQNLAADFHQVWEIPSISKVSGAAVGCFHLKPDGTIAESKFETSGDDMLDDSVQRALKATQKLRNDKPLPVPTEQLGVITKWVCFRFNPNQ